MPELLRSAAVAPSSGGFTTDVIAARNEIRRVNFTLPTTPLKFVLNQKQNLALNVQISGGSLCIHKQDAQQSQRERAARCVIVFAKSRRLELGDNLLRTL